MAISLAPGFTLTTAAPIDNLLRRYPAGHPYAADGLERAATDLTVMACARQLTPAEVFFPLLAAAGCLGIPRAEALKAIEAGLDRAMSRARGRYPRRHKCGVQHRTHKVWARCHFRARGWVSGEGRWAVLSRCRTWTVSLHETHADALASLAWIDQLACGGACTRSHELWRLPKRKVA